MPNDCKQIRTAGSKVKVLYQEKAKVIPEADGMKCKSKVTWVRRISECKDKYKIKDETLEQYVIQHLSIIF